MEESTKAGLWASPTLDTGGSGIDLSSLSPKDLDEALFYARAQLLEQAREFSLGGVLAFTALVGKDERGAPIEPAPLHVSWYAHIFYCWMRDLVPVILAPWGHGKSANIAILLPTFLLGHDSDLRIKTVCNSDENSVKRVRSVRTLLGASAKDRDPALGMVFPGLRRGNGVWNDHAITVRRSHGAVAADASLEAHGIFGIGIGGRCDCLILDDVTDRRNSVEHPVMRKRVIETAKGTWQSRLEPTGRQVDIMTRWHEADLAADRISSQAYCVMVQSVSPDQSCLTVEVHNAPDNSHPAPDTLPLWSARWNAKALRRRRAEIGDREYARGFEQRAYSDEELWFPSWPSTHRRMRVDDVPGMRDAVCVTGWDPASKHRRGTALVTVAVTPDGVRVPVDVRLGKWAAPRAADEMDRVDALVSPTVLMVESNAMQDDIADWAKASGRAWWPRIRPFLTGRNKANPEHGLRSLDVEFNAGAWIWPDDEPVDPRTGERCDAPRGVPLRLHRTGCDCAWCLLDHQLRTYPACDDTDLAMATWFCREGARQRIGSGNMVPSAERFAEGRKEAPASLRLVRGGGNRTVKDRVWAGKRGRRGGY